MKTAPFTYVALLLLAFVFAAVAGFFWHEQAVETQRLNDDLEATCRRVAELEKYCAAHPNHTTPPAEKADVFGEGRAAWEKPLGWQDAGHCKGLPALAEAKDGTDEHPPILAPTRVYAPAVCVPAVAPVLPVSPYQEPYFGNADFFGFRRRVVVRH